MALPAVQLLCLEQGDRSLEQHTSDFLQLACLTHFPDRSLCIYYRTGLSERSKARIPAGGPTEDFAAYVEWVLVNNHSQFTIGPAEDDTSTTPHPETNHPPSTTCTMEKREPTADRGDRPVGTIETEPEERTEGVVAPGCEPLGVSDQVREPVTSCAVEGVLVEFEGWEESPDHNNTTVDGIVITTETFLDLLDVFEEVYSPCLVSPLVPSSSELFVSPLVPSSSELFVFPAGPVQPSVPSQPPSHHRCLPWYPSASHQLHHGNAWIRLDASGHQCHRGLRFSWLRLQPSSPTLHRGLSTLRLRRGSSLPRLHRIPSASRLHRAPSSHRLRLGQTSSSLHLRFRLAPPSPPVSSFVLSRTASVCLRVPRFHLGCSSSRLQLGLQIQQCRSGSPAFQLHLDHHHRWLLHRPSPRWRLISPRWCSSSSTPPWGLIMVGLWTNIWLLLLQASPWLLPPSTPPWTIFGFYGLLCISSFCLSPSSRAPTPPSSVGLHTARGRAYLEGGDMLHVLCPVT
ncbi:hypothetical protein DPX16_21792 [Anabarilius grahami]|uniref:Uncharacterized protein n=1 Tax=Anabarilius grahami TaxID=495550 RepID=A0A3N0Z5G0_ANAGA|nr:hypothetical protein DPX16_21792 [Anabarilius grahami]